MITKIGVGNAPNDGLGQPLRDAFVRVNSNYDWLTNKIGTDDKQVVLQGGQPGRSVDITQSTDVWEDLNFNIATLNPVGIGSPATLVSNSGQPPNNVHLALSFTTNNTLYVAAQTQHHWTPGTIVFPHIHVQPQLNTANTITWTLRYSVSDIDGTFGGVIPDGTITNFHTDIPAGSQWKHLLLDMPAAGINLAGMLGPSTVIRLFYVVTASTNPFHVLNFDVHIRHGGFPVLFTP